MGYVAQNVILRVPSPPVTDRDLMGLETMVLRAVWGATRLSRAKEVVFLVMTPGHRICPVMHTSTNGCFG